MFVVSGSDSISGIMASKKPTVNTSELLRAAYFMWGQDTERLQVGQYFLVPGL